VLKKALEESGGGVGSFGGRENSRGGGAICSRALSTKGSAANGGSGGGGKEKGKKFGRGGWRNRPGIRTRGKFRGKLGKAKPVKKEQGKSH